jgi:acetyltransferase-like isoleucine patch superfamily enzyme
LTRTYTELGDIPDFEGRYNYLRTHSEIGVPTFGYERWLNQGFYTSAQWRQTRNVVIARDLGCDLGVEGYEIFDRVIIHHMNPITPSQVQHGDEALIDPEFLISVSQRTHNAIHYGDASLLVKPLVKRRPNDTKLW